MPASPPPPLDIVTAAAAIAVRMSCTVIDHPYKSNTLLLEIRQFRETKHY